MELALPTFGVFGLLLVWIIFNGVAATPPSLTWDPTATTTSQIQFDLVVYNLTAFIKRDDVSALTGQSNGTIIDQGYLGNSPGTGLNPGTEYTYYTEDSAGVNTTEKMCTLPVPPSNLEAFTLNQTQAYLVFARNESNGEIMSGFGFTESGGATGWSPDTSAAGTTFLAIDGLTAFTNYTFEIFQMFQCADSGNTTVNSSSVTYDTIRTAPDTPVIAGATAASETSLVLNLTIANDAVELSYELYRNETLIETFVNANYTGSTSVSHNDSTGLEPGTIYEYLWIAVDSFSGLSSESAGSQFCTNPDIAVDLVATSMSDTVSQIDWGAPSGGATSYNVGWASPTDTSPTPTSETALSKNLTALQPADDYTVNIQTVYTCPATQITGAADANQLSDSNVTLLFYTAPSKPTIQAFELDVISSGTNSIQLQWSPGAADVQETTSIFKYEISRSVDGTSYDPIATNLAFDVLVRTDTGLDPATLYYYKVQSFYNGSGSELSDADIACTYPSAPVNVQINVINSTHLECLWASPDTNGDALSGFEVDFNSNGNPVYVTKDVTSNVTFVGDTDFSPGIVLDGPNTCYVRAVVNCSDDTNLLKSSWSTVTSFVAPSAPSVNTTSLSDSTILIQVIPNPANSNNQDMLATIYRDGTAIVSDLAFPWIYEDSLDLVPGREYKYQGRMETNENPSERSPVKLECARPAPAEALSATAINTTAIELSWAMPDGEVDYFFVSSNDDASDTTFGLVPTTGTDSRYTIELGGLTVGNCFTMEVISVRDCNTSDADFATATNMNITSSVATMSACTKPATPGLTVGPGDLGEMVVLYNITDSDYLYHLWRSTSPTVDPDDYLDTSVEIDGTFIDTYNIVGGYVYCYKAAVEKFGVISAIGPLVCSCSTPNPVIDLRATNYTDTTMNIQWSNPDGNFSYSNIQFNNQEDNTTGQVNSYYAGYAPASSLTLTDNTPYSIHVRNVILCTVGASDVAISSPPTSLQDKTSSRRPVMVAETAPNSPSAITLSYYLADGTSEFSFLLERDGAEVVGTVGNPYVDSGLSPATTYAYTGYLVSDNGATSPASQTITFCTHPARAVNLFQDNSTVTSVTVQWENPEIPPEGYYIMLDELANRLVTDNSLVPGQADRVAKFSAAVTGKSAREPATTLTMVVDGGGLTPANSYQIGLTGCIDCVSSDFGALTASDASPVTNVTLEMCSFFASVTTYTRPEQPSCSVVTESVSVLQVTASQNPLDANPGTFVIYRNDSNLSLAEISDAQMPWIDNFEVVPGTEYEYSVFIDYNGWWSEAATCIGCANPRPPSNFEGVAVSDQVIALTWDNPTLETIVNEYDVSNGKGTWVNVGLTLANNYTGLTASTCYDMLVRSRVDCTTGTPVFSAVRTFTTCTQPVPCQIVSVEPAGIGTADYEFKVEIELTYQSGHTYNIYRDGEVFAENVPTTNAYYVDDQILSGSYHCYQCTGVRNGVEGISGNEVCGCSRPGEPIQQNFESLSPNEVKLTWAAPDLNAAYTSFDVMDSFEVIHSTTDEFLVWPVSLSAMKEYRFYIRTVYDCVATGGTVTLTSDWVEVTAYTSPGIPVLEQVDEGTDFIVVNLIDYLLYDETRLFVDQEEVIPSPTEWPYEATNLVPGQSYSFFVIAVKFGLYNTSEVLVWCTDPEIPTNLDSVTRYFYGFQVRFDPPTTGYTSGFEVWSDVDSTWHMTNLTNGTFLETFYYYNFEIGTDFDRNLATKDTDAIITGGLKDWAYSEPRLQVGALQSGSSYTIKVRSFKVCEVDEHDVDPYDKVFTSEAVVGSAVTGAHPVINIQTYSVSQTEIQVDFEPFGDHGEDIQFNIYRYFNGSSTAQAVFTNVLLADLPFRDTGLEPASLYTYEVSVVHRGLEIFDYSRIILESEYFPGDRSDPIIDIATYDTNREGAWRGFTYGGVGPTHVNKYDISGEHDINTFHYREKTACTYPPNPTSVTWHVENSTHNSTYISWTVDDYSHALSMTHPIYGSINVTILFFVNGEMVSQLFDDVTSSQYLLENLEQPKSAYTCQVAIGLTCPDEKVNLDVEVYGTGSIVGGYMQSTTFNPVEIDLDSNLISFESDLTRNTAQTICYTRPSPVTIKEFKPAADDPTTQLTVDYTQPESGLTYEVFVTTELSESPLSVNTTIESEDTLSFQTIEGLVPGHAYSVEMWSFWRVNSDLTIYSLPAPYQYTPELTLLSDNGQTNLYDPVYGCTLPADLNDLEVFGVNNETIGATWTAPDGQSQLYTFDLLPDGVLDFSRNYTPTGVFATPGESFSDNFGPFIACQTINVNITVTSSCGVYLEPTTSSQLLTTYTTPVTPFWIPASCSSDSNSAITLVFEDTNAASCPLVYTVYRDSVESVDADNKGSVKTMTDDEDLLAGTVYQYEVSATAYNQTSPRSTVLQICTKPNPPSTLEFVSDKGAGSFVISWNAPSVGSATGYYLTDNLGNSDVLVLGTTFKYVGQAAGTEHSVSVSLKSYLECQVTGVSPVRELVSDTSYDATVVAVTAPAPLLLRRHESTSETTFVMEVKVAFGTLSRIHFRSSQSLTSEPTCENGTFTALDPAIAKNFLFYPDAPVSANVTFLVEFLEMPDDGTVVNFEVFASFDGSITADETSKSSGIAYKYKKPKKIMGMDEHVGVIVIAVIVIVCVAALVAFVTVAVFILLKIRASAPVVPATGQEAHAGEGQSGNLWNDPNPDGDYRITDTYHYRTEFIATTYLNK